MDTARLGFSVHENTLSNAMWNDLETSPNVLNASRITHRPRLTIPSCFYFHSPSLHG